MNKFKTIELLTGMENLCRLNSDRKLIVNNVDTFINFFNKLGKEIDVEFWHDKMPNGEEWIFGADSIEFFETEKGIEITMVTVVPVIV